MSKFEREGQLFNSNHIDIVFELKFYYLYNTSNVKFYYENPALERKPFIISCSLFR